MKTLVSVRSLLLAAVLFSSPLCQFAGPSLLAQSATTTAKVGILNREQAGAVLPEKVFYRGLSAPIQARNSAGVRFADSKLVLTALVDTSGYSTAVKETYQAYLITEVPLKVGDKMLAPGLTATASSRTIRWWCWTLARTSCLPPRRHAMRRCRGRIRCRCCPTRVHRVVTASTLAAATSRLKPRRSRTRCRGRISLRGAWRLRSFCFPSSAMLPDRLPVKRHRRIWMRRSPL